MKSRIFFMVAVILGCLELNVFSQQYYPVRDRLEVTSLDGTWQFRLQESTEWSAIRVPGNWETQGVKVPEYGRDLKSMTGIYRRTFPFREEWRGRDVVLRLDGVQHGFTVMVNGHKAGTGHSGHTMHQMNITPYLKEGNNDIEIYVTTHSRYWLFDVCDAWSYTGIKRSVELFSIPKEASLADVVFTSKVNQDNSADVTVRIKTNGRMAARVTASLLDERYNHICDLQGSVQDGIAIMQSHLSRPRLWNAETPNLYSLNVKLYDAQGRKMQSIEEKVGIREVRTENCKILLNNREIFLRGACLSENDAIEGSAMSQFNRRRQLEQMKAANINFIRTAHYPLDPMTMRLCDEMGFYVCEEIPYASRGDGYLKSDPDVVTELRARAKATVDRDRNCPSIIMWSHGNENEIYPCQDSVLLFTKEYDPSRLRGVPQMEKHFMKYVNAPSPYIDVVCVHYAKDNQLAEACKKSALPIINTEYAHSLGTAFGDMEHKYDIFRREPKIAGGSVWCYQDQSVLIHNFNQRKQVLKGVRIDSLRYIDCYGLNPIAKGATERKEGTDGIVYGDGYPQEDYFELAQVYTPVAFSGEFKMDSLEFTTEVGNLFDFISLHGYSIHWQLKQWHQVLDEGTVWLSAKARDTEIIHIPLNGAWKRVANSTGYLCMQVLRPDGSLCYEKSIRLNNGTDYRNLIKEAKSDNNSKTLRFSSFASNIMLRVGRPITIGLDYRRKNLWQPYLLEPVDVRVKKQKDGCNVTCRWQRKDKPSQYVEGDIAMVTAKDGTMTIDYRLFPSDSIGGQFLDYGLAIRLPKDYDQVAWMGQGPFSQTPDKTAYNNYGVWQLHCDDIRFYGNRADVDLLSVQSPQETITLCSDNRNIHLENVDGRIVLTDNLIVGTYGSKGTSPRGKDAAKTGARSGRITLKANTADLLETIFGQRHNVNPEQPYLESYGK